MKATDGDRGGGSYCQSLFVTQAIFEVLNVSNLDTQEYDPTSACCLAIFVFKNLEIQLVILTPHYF